jgi:hypothetical protein
MFALLETILIRPLKDKTYSQKQVVLDDEKNKGKDPMKDEMETKVATTKVAYEIQKAVVEYKPDNIEVPYDVGDTIYYHKNRQGVPFRWVKNTFLLKPYDVVGYEVSTD